jgi:hypothetical protein
MSLVTLKALASEEFELLYCFISTPAALYRSLKKSSFVDEIVVGMERGVITEAHIKSFTDSLMSSLRRGEPFKYDLAIAALCVVLERRATQFADEFLGDLASLELVEMKMSIRVARQCLAHRKEMTKTSRAEDVISIELPRTSLLIPYDNLGLRFPNREVSESRREIYC